MREVEIARMAFGAGMHSAENAQPSSPLISLVTSVYNTPPQYLDDLLYSFQMQEPGLAELILSEDGSTSPSTCSWLERNKAVAGLIIHRCPENKGIAAAANSGVKASHGRWVGFIDHDDALAPFALAALAKVINENPEVKFIYTVELVVDGKLRGLEYFLKPAFDRVLLSGMNYINHLSLYRRDRLLNIGCLRVGFEGSQDYDLVLRYVAELEDCEVRHLPYPAYMWRRDGASYSIKHLDRTTANARRALAEAYAKNGDAIPVDEAVDSRLHRVRFDVTKESFPKVSIVIPNRNSYSLEPLAKFIERGEFSLCSRGGGAGAQAGAGLSCVTRSI